MRALTAAEMLEVWERGASLNPTRRALALLSASDPDSTLEGLAGLRIGERDARLLALRETVFGPQLTGLVICPECSQRSTVDLRSADLQLAVEKPRSDPQVVSMNGEQVHFRLPTSRDLLDLPDSKDLDSAEQVLLQRCIVDVTQEGEKIAAEDLTSDMKELVMEQMALADPLALIELFHVCPDCDHQWHSIFDISVFFWSEVNTWAQRLLMEVHLLASSYAWREQDILSMSPWRRQAYLELIAG